MKKLITIFFILIAFGAFSQINTYDIKTGQYAIYNSGASGNVTIERKYTSDGVIAYRNRVDVVDTIFAVTSTSSLAELATFTRPSGMIAGISFPDSAVYRSTITVPDDSIVYYTKKTNGNNAIIEGSDIVTGMSSDSTFTEKVTNGDFTTDTDWTKGSGWTIDDGDSNVAHFDALHINSALFQSNVVETGKTYKITFTVSNKGAGTLALRCWIQASQQIFNVSANGTYTTTFTATTQTGLYFSVLSTNTATFDLDDVSVQEITANPNVWVKTGITNQPYLAWGSDTLGTLVSSVSELDSIREWYWSGDSLYVYSSTDPSGNIEIAQRDILIEMGSTDDYITLKNLTIQKSNSIALRLEAGGNSRGAIYMYEGDNLTISGCTIQDNSLHGIHVLNSSNLLIDNCTVLRNGVDYLGHYGRNMDITSLNVPMDNITVSNTNSSYAQADGCMIYANNVANRITNINIHGNTFNHNKAAGAYTIKADTVAIYNNTFDSNGDIDAVGEDYAIGSQSCNNIDIYQNTITNQLYNDAIQLYSQGTETGHNARVFRNYINGVTDGDGIGIAEIDDQSMQNLEIYYNVVANADEYGILLYRSGSGTSSNPEIYNNTLYNNTSGNIYSMLNFPVTIKNNIFSGDVIGITAGTLTSGLTTSNNLWHRVSGDVLNYGGTTYTTATITNFEATAQTGDPLFTDAVNGDFTLQAGSPAINNGVNVGFTKDINGNPIVGTPDIGAYEKQ